MLDILEIRPQREQICSFITFIYLSSHIIKVNGSNLMEGPQYGTLRYPPCDFESVLVVKKKKGTNGHTFSYTSLAGIDVLLVTKITALQEYFHFHFFIW